MDEDADFTVFYMLEEKKWQIGEVHIRPDNSPRRLVYLAPEILRGSQSCYTKETDIWALGCLAHELAHLKPVFDSPEEILRYHAGDFSPDAPDKPITRFLCNQLYDSLLNRSAEQRPIAAEVSNVFEFNLRFFELPISGILTCIDSKLPYSTWLELQLTTEPSDESIPIPRIAMAFEKIGQIQVAFAMSKEIAYQALMSLEISPDCTVDDGLTTEQLKSELGENLYDIRLWYRLCQLYLANNDKTKAIVSCKEEIKIHRSNVAPVLTLSNIYAKEENFDEATQIILNQLDGDEYAIPRSEDFSPSRDLSPMAHLKSLASSMWGSYDRGNMTLLWAAWTGNLSEVRRHREESGSRRWNCQKGSFTPLHAAVWNNHEAVAEELMNSQSVVARFQGWEPILLAIMNGNTELIKKLIRAGADCYTETDRKGTALHWAAEYGNSAAIEFIHSARQEVDRARARIDPKDEDDATPLHMSASYGFVEASETLLRLGADIEKRDHEGMTPLLCAAEHSQLQSIKYLLSCGANICCMDKNAWTVLHYAVKSKDPHIVRFLAQHIAGIRSRNQLGDGTFDFVMSHADRHNRQILVESGVLPDSWRLLVPMKFESFEAATLLFDKSPKSLAFCVVKEGEKVIGGQKRKRAESQV